MHRKLKDDDNKDAGNPKNKQNKTGSANDSPGNKMGRRSRTASPVCSSSQLLNSRKSVISTPEHQRSSVLSTGGHRTLTLTPENSSTQRELKKLEDYWTRNNPVKEDSPRLRSTRKVIFNIKDCFSERKSPKPQQHEVKSEQSVNTKLQKCLPESPIPAIQQASATCEINDASLNKKKGQSNNQDVSAHTEEDIDSISDKLDENNKPFKENAEPTTNNVATPEVTDIDSSDSDDDDYLPPRKKLRSEVSQDELWEGIPLTVSFKRLAPIPKVSSLKTSDDNLKTFSANVHNSKEEENSTETGRDEDFRHLTKSVTNATPTNTDASFTGQTSESGIKRKRSTRLKEKNTGTLAKSKGTNISSEEHSPVVCVTRINYSFNPEDSCPKIQSTDGNDSYSKCDMNETVLYANKDEVESEETKADNDNPGETLLSLTLSQILSDDNKGNDLNEVITNGRKIDDDGDDETTDIEAENKKSPTCATSSFSKTINEIFEEISGSDGLPEEHSNEKDAISSDFVEDSSPRMVTRCSRRLSGIETETHNRKRSNNEYGKDKVHPESVDGDINTTKFEKKSQTDYAKESTSKITDIKFSSSKHTIFTKKQNKCAKTVPPLRIKLKQSINKIKKDRCISKSNQRSKEPSLKVVKTIDEKKGQKATPTNKKRRHFQESPLGSSEKEVITPLKNKKKKEKARKWSSPPSTIELRLNSERRLSAAGSLLSNPMLNKHACVLWSSENRRHMQLSNPHATLSELDEKLSRKWDSLSEKEKLRYFQRARDAIKDENRHSNRRIPDSNNRHSDVNATKKYEDDCCVTNFQKLPPALQMSEIKKWLNFYNEVSPDTCSLIIRTFKEALVEENKNKAEKEREREKSKMKSKKCKQKKKEERVTNIDSNANYRKMLFEKIQEQKENVKDVLTAKRRDQSKSVLESFSGMLKRIVSGEVFHFTGDVRSDRLTETLSELRALEKDNKLAVTGSVSQDDKDFGDILTRLRSWNSPDGKSLVCSLEGIDTDAVNIDSKCKKIIRFPTLSPKSIENNLPDIETPAKSKVNLFSPLRIEKFNRTSPVSVLTEMVADDIIKQQPQIGFRNAISLLSNKIVPSPTILPPKGMNIDKSSGNRNQNCNVVFTKLINSRPSFMSTQVNLLN